MKSTRPKLPSGRIGVVDAYRIAKPWFGIRPPLLAMLLDGFVVALPFAYIGALYFAHGYSPFITFAYRMPIKLLCGVIVATFVLGSIGMLDVLRIIKLIQRSARGVTEDETASVGNIIAAAGIFYGLVMGVIATATWDDFKLVSESVQKEVGAAGNMFEFAAGYPDGYRDQLRSRLIYYVSDVIVCDWDDQKRGIFVKSHDKDLAPLIGDVVDYSPQTPKEQILHPAVLGELGKLVDAREARVRAITGIALPEILWVVVSACSFIVLFLVCWGPAQETRPPWALVLSWGALVGFVVFLVVAMDHPLWGELSVSQDPYVGLQTQWVIVSNENHAKYEIIKNKSDCNKQQLSLRGR